MQWTELSRIKKDAPLGGEEMEQRLALYELFLMYHSS